MGDADDLEIMVPQDIQIGDDDDDVWYDCHVVECQKNLYVTLTVWHMFSLEVLFIICSFYILLVFDHNIFLYNCWYLFVLHKQYFIFFLHIVLQHLVLGSIHV